MTKVLYKGKEVDIKYRNDVIFKKILADDDKESRMALSFLLSAVTHRSFVHLTVMNSEMISQFSSLTGKTIAEYMLPVPSIDRQKQVVDILDKFYAICNDLEIGLPAEITARQKQYEYYRDKLLTFQELK